MIKNKDLNLEQFQTDFSGYKYSISFVGDPSKGICLNILCDIVKVFKRKLHIFTTKTKFLQSLKKIEEQNLLDKEDLAIFSNCQKDLSANSEDLAKIYNSTRVNLLIDTGNKSNVNSQILEVLTSGGFLITNEKKYLSKYFDISKHIETYKDNIDLIDKINFYLNNLNIAQKIAQLGKFEASNIITSQSKNEVQRN